jgi:uncharacterized membrane protein
MFHVKHFGGRATSHSAIRFSKNSILASRATVILSAAGLAALFVLLAVRWPQIPEQAITHYGWNGMPDGYEGKATLLFCPLMALGILVLLTVVEQFPHAWSVGVEVTDNNRAAVYSFYKILLAVLRPVSVFGLAGITVFEVFGSALPVWYLPVFLVALFVPLIIVLALVHRAAE